MSIKRINIEIPKINYQVITLSITEDEQPTQLGENDLIFMTVRHSPDDENYKFQKSLDNGITFNEETNQYEIEIFSEDTKDLKYNTTYGYDITIYYDGNKPRQKVVGDFKISNQYTLNGVI